jgi:hypothetical protein
MSEKRVMDSSQAIKLHAMECEQLDEPEKSKVFAATWDDFFHFADAWQKPAYRGHSLVLQTPSCNAGPAGPFRDSALVIGTSV